MDEAIDKLRLLLEPLGFVVKKYVHPREVVVVATLRVRPDNHPLHGRLLSKSLAYPEADLEMFAANPMLRAAWPAHMAHLVLTSVTAELARPAAETPTTVGR